jgi:repressor LexA
MSLSERQRQILEIVRNAIESTGYPPSVREIQHAAGISSTSVVDYNLRRLEEKGYLVRDRDVSRGIRLLHLTPQRSTGLVTIPVLGRIAAGQPLLLPDTQALADATEHISVSASLLPDSRDLYALEVRGNSMVDALVSDGDTVIVRRQETAEDGDMVVAWLRDEGETTLKYFYREGDRVRLQPANPYMAPIFVDAAGVEVHGRVIMVIRLLSRN